jgi:SAM-dependent methyltransferase
MKADHSIYAEEGFDAYKDYHAGTRPFPRWAEPLIAAPPISCGRALDIGCGDGMVLHRLEAVGLEPFGIDLDVKSVAIARTKFGLRNVETATLRDFVNACRERALRFDLITFFEVLEHQDDPVTFLQQVASLGTQCGWVAGSVPNRDRFLAHLDRRISAGDLPPHHFLWFSKRSLANLLERAGLCDATITPAGNLARSQISEKLRALIDKRSLKLSPMWGRALRALLAPVLPVVSLAISLGMRRSPSHLYFLCRIQPTSVANDNGA